MVDMDDARSFVVADIPGLIEGASKGVGLGHAFLRHVDRTRVLVHVVDAAATEGRDPLLDIELIENELAEYDKELAGKRQIIAANKIDMLENGKDSDIIKKIRDRYKGSNIEVYPVSTLTGEGLKDLLYAVSRLLDEIDLEPVVYDAEYDPETELKEVIEAYTVKYDSKTKEYLVEGSLIDKMLGYTNIESEKGFIFFQKFLKDNKVLERLKKEGVKEGDTIRMYGHAFEYMDEDAEFDEYDEDSEDKDY